MKMTKIEEKNFFKELEEFTNEDNNFPVQLSSFNSHHILDKFQGLCKMSSLTYDQANIVTSFYSKIKIYQKELHTHLSNFTYSITQNIFEPNNEIYQQKILTSCFKILEKIDKKINGEVIDIANFDKDEDFVRQDTEIEYAVDMVLEIFRNKENSYSFFNQKNEHEKPQNTHSPYSCI